MLPPSRPARTSRSLLAITPDELLRKLTATEQANGFANRFLWVYVERPHLRPEGGTLDQSILYGLAREIRDALDKARRTDGVVRDEEAKELWQDVYPYLTRDVPGMTGAMRSRAEAQTLRLSLCYALLDSSQVIRREHLEAALELWDYCERSLFRIFGDALGDAHADRIREALRAARDGLTRTEITGLFNRNLAADVIERALGRLAEAGLAFPEAEQTGGRPIERWHARRDDDEATR
jgi:hypothetical protein